MKQVLYAKYNRTRKPDYQISTKIVKVDGVKYVEKTALREEAVSHIQNIYYNRELVSKMYRGILPCPAVLEHDTIRFDYIQGNTFQHQIEVCMPDIDAVTDAIKQAVERILRNAYDCAEPFRETDQFCAMFGQVDGLEGLPAFSGMDIDPNFENFIDTGEHIYNIDYEWVLKIPIPVSYVKFRIVFYYYCKNHVFFSRHFTVNDYLKACGIEEHMIDRFQQMEESFQQYVHGENREYIYTNHYVKQSHNINALLNQYHDIESELSKKHARIEEQECQIREQECQIREQEHKIDELEQLRVYKTSYEEIVNSKAWKLTGPIRRLFNIPGCVREHGWKYAIRYALSLFGHHTN